MTQRNKNNSIIISNYLGEFINVYIKQSKAKIVKVKGIYRSTISLKSIEFNSYLYLLTMYFANMYMLDYQFTAIIYCIDLVFFQVIQVQKTRGYCEYPRTYKDGYQLRRVASPYVVEIQHLETVFFSLTSLEKRIIAQVNENKQILMLTNFHELTTCFNSIIKNELG